MTAAAPAAYIEPQPGPQRRFLECQADLCIFGGSAGGGKSFGLLLEAARHVSNSGYAAVIFRRTTPEIRAPGGLWARSMELYPSIGGSPRETTLEWRFPSGATIKFAHLEYEKNLLDWHGAEIALIGFDELTHFEERQFVYLLSRNRSTCGVRPYIRATTNPHALSWVKSFLSPWLDKDHPAPADDGEVRWMIRVGDEIQWVPKGTPHAKSVTFIRSTLYDNPKLLERDPGYESNLLALPLVDRQRLLHGDWDITEGGNMFRRDWFEIRAQAPRELMLLRAWDMAATEPKPGEDPDWTVGTLMGLDSRNIAWILDQVAMRGTPGATEALIKQTAQADDALYGPVPIRMEQEPGSSGVTVIDDYRRRVLLGRDFDGQRSTGSKAVRAKPYSQAAEAGNVKLVQAHWNHAFLGEHEIFPLKAPGVHDDRVDSASLAFSQLANVRVLEFS